MYSFALLLVVSCWEAVREQVERADLRSFEGLPTVQGSIGLNLS